MLNHLSRVFKQLIDGNDLSKQETMDESFAIACMLLEVSNADHTIDESESQVLPTLIEKLCHVDAEQANTLIHRAKERIKQSTSLFEFTSHLRQLSQEQRIAVIESMWDVAHADGVIEPLEDAVIRKAAELLYVDHSQFIRAKLNAAQRAEF